MHKLIQIIEELELNLHGKVIITEAATGPYAATVAAAAYAGAEVHAFVRESKYGSVEEVKSQVLNLCQQLNSTGAIHFYESKDQLPWERADVITNSGSLRPILDEYLTRCKSTCVLTLMFEAWEYREQDFRLETCKKKGIQVGGVNERHPDVDVFGYLGDMVIRLIQDAGITPYRNKFLVVGNNDFVPYMLKPLVHAAQRVGVFTLAKYKQEISELGAEYLGEFDAFNVSKDWESSEAVVYTGSPFTQARWTNEDVLKAKELQKLAKPLLLRFAGDIDETALQKNQIACYPAVVPSGHMGIIPSQIGWDPILRLQTGGLKVAELMHKNETHYKGIELVQYL